MKPGDEMSENSKEYVLKMARDHGVKFIRLWFTDMLGFLKSFAITVEELEETLECGKSFDGSSIQGFTRVDESDMIAMPDHETFSLLPWRPADKGNSVARMFCDIYNPGGRTVRIRSPSGAQTQPGPCRQEWFYLLCGRRTGVLLF